MTLPTVPSYAAPRRVRILATTVAYRDVHRSPYDAERQRSSASGWHTGLMHYAAKCGWPGVSERELEQATARARGARSNTGARGVDYLGSLLCFRTTTSFSACEAPSRAAVKHATERAGVPCERVMNSVWPDPHRSTLEGTENCASPQQRETTHD